jgi:hypothetical protein
MPWFFTNFTTYLWMQVKLSQFIPISTSDPRKLLDIYIAVTSYSSCSPEIQTNLIYLYFKISVVPHLPLFKELTDIKLRYSQFLISFTLLLCYIQKYGSFENYNLKK